MRSWAHSFSLQFERFWSLQVVLWVTCSPRSLGQKRRRSRPAPGGSWWKKCCSRGILQPGAQKVHLDAITQLGRCYLCLSFLNSETSHGRGCPFLPWGLELFLFLVWDISSRSGRAWLESPGSQGRMEAEHLFHHPNRSRVFPLISSCLKLPEAPSKFLEIKRHCQVQYHCPVT